MLSVILCFVCVVVVSVAKVVITHQLAKCIKQKIPSLSSRTERGNVIKKNCCVSKIV